MSSQEYQISQCAFCFINPRAGEFKSNIWLSSITSLNPFLKFIKLTVMRISHQFVRIIARTDIFTCISVEVALLTLSSLIWTGPAIKINIWSNTGNRWWLIMVIMAERSLYFYILSITTSPPRLTRALRQKYRTENWWWLVTVT